MPTHKDMPRDVRDKSSGRHAGSATFEHSHAKPLDVEEVTDADAKSKTKDSGNDGGAAAAKKSGGGEKSAVKSDGRKPTRLERLRTNGAALRAKLGEDAVKARMARLGKFAARGTGVMTAGWLAMDAFDRIRARGEILHHAPEPPRTDYLPVAHTGQVDNPHDNGNSVEDLDAVVADVNKASFDFEPSQVCSYCDTACSGGCTGVDVGATELDAEVLAGDLVAWMNRAAEIPSIFAATDQDTWTERMAEVYSSVVDLVDLQDRTQTVTSALTEAIDASNRSAAAAFEALRSTVRAGREEMNRRVQHDNDSLAWMVDAFTSHQGEGSVDRLRAVRAELEKAEAENDDALKTFNAALNEWNLSIAGSPVTGSPRSTEPVRNVSDTDKDTVPPVPPVDNIGDTTPVDTGNVPPVDDAPFTDTPFTDAGMPAMPSMPGMDSGGFPGMDGGMPATGSGGGLPFDDAAMPVDDTGTPFDDLGDDEDLADEDDLDDELADDEDEALSDEEDADDDDEALDDEALDGDADDSEGEDDAAVVDDGELPPVAADTGEPVAGDTSSDIAARTVTLEDGRAVTMPNMKTAEMLRAMMASETTAPMSVSSAMAEANIPMADSGMLGTPVAMTELAPGDVVTDSNGACGVYLGGDDVMMENHEVQKIGDLDLTGTDSGAFRLAADDLPVSGEPVTEAPPADDGSVSPLVQDAAVPETTDMDNEDIMPLGSGVDLVS